MTKIEFRVTAIYQGELRSDGQTELYVSPLILADVAEAIEEALTTHGVTDVNIYLDNLESKS